MKLLKEDPNLAREIEPIIININGENIHQLAVGNNNIFFNIETSSRENYIKIVNPLNPRTKEAANLEIMSYYNPSMLPEYPERLKKFVTENRAYKLREALKYLEKHRILLISGVGGVGKTTLARALIDLKPGNVPEPFWFSFYKNPDVKLSDILEKLAAYMKAPEITAFKSERREPGKIDVDKLTGELHRRSEIWLFFDDLNTVLEDTKFSDKEIEILFSSLRYSTHNAKIIITSRILPKLGNEDSLIDVVEDEEKQHLNGLSTDFAVDYLAKNGLGSLEQNKLEELVTGVDGHPLALKLLISLVKKYGASDTLKDLTRYKKLREDIIKKTKKLFDKLARDERELLECISVYRKDEIMDAIEIMFTDRTPIDAVDNLIDDSLLETDHNGNYWLHPLVQEFSYDDLENKKEVHNLAMNYYLHLPIPEKPAKKEDIQYLIEAHYHACMAEKYDQAFDIIFDNNLYIYLYLWGNNTILIDIYSKLLPDNHFGTEILLKNKGKHGVILRNLGNVYWVMGETRKAIEYHEKAFKIAQEIGDRLNEGNQLGNLGNVYKDMGETRKTIEYHEKALKIEQEIGNRRNEGN